MTAYSKTLSTHQTAASGVADTVTLEKDYAAVEVVNRDGAGALYVTVGNADSAPTTPTIGADSTYVLPAAICSRVIPSVELSGAATVVKIIASADTKYSVIGLEDV